MNNFNCPSCGMEFEYSEELAGRKCECPACGVKFIVAAPVIERVSEPPPSATPRASSRRRPPKPSPARPQASHAKRAPSRRRARSAPSAQRQPRSKSKKGLVVTLLVLAVAGGGAGTAFFLRHGKQENRLGKNGGGAGGVSDLPPLEAFANQSSESSPAEQPSQPPRMRTPPLKTTPASASRSMPPPPSGVYSGFDTAGVESIVEKFEKGGEPWLKAADARIDKYRKSDLTVKVLDAGGHPVPNATVSVEMTKHQFHFGGIINAGAFRKDEALYKKTFLKMGFNSSGFCNSLKYKLRRGAEKNKPWGIIEWLRSKGIYVRGHCLIWPGRAHMPKTIEELVKNNDGSEPSKDKLGKACDAMIREWASKWDVDEWDVMNEPRGNHAIQDILGYEIEKHWFDVARRFVKNGKRVRLCFNDNNVISNFKRWKKRKNQPPWDPILTCNIKIYRKNLERLIAEKAPLDFLGFQSRFTKKIPPETIYKRLKVFDKYNLPIVATEFEMKQEIGTELEKAELTAEVMAIYFSHHLVDGIYAWSLFSTSDGREILNQDGTPNLRGKIWLYLTKNRWATRKILTTGSDGTASLRAFKGEYSIKVETPVGKKTVEATLDGDATVTVRL